METRFTIHRFYCSNRRCLQFLKEYSGIRASAARCIECGTMQKTLPTVPLDPSSELHRALIRAGVRP